MWIKMVLNWKKCLKIPKCFKFSLINFQLTTCSRKHFLPALNRLHNPPGSSTTRHRAVEFNGLKPSDLSPTLDFTIRRRETVLRIVNFRLSARRRFHCALVDRANGKATKFPTFCDNMRISRFLACHSFLTQIIK